MYRGVAEGPWFVANPRTELETNHDCETNCKEWSGNSSNNGIACRSLKTVGIFRMQGHNRDQNVRHASQYSIMSSFCVFILF